MVKIFSIIFGLMIFFATLPAFGQQGGSRGGRNSPISDSPCWTKPYLGATPEQVEALADLHRAFYKELLPLRNQYMTERHELRSMLANPKPNSKMVMARQSGLSAVQKKMDEISIQYLLKARAIFTPEQLSNLPSSCNLGFNYGSGMGWGRGMGQRNR